MDHRKYEFSGSEVLPPAPRPRCAILKLIFGEIPDGILVAQTWVCELWNSNMDYSCLSHGELYIYIYLYGVELYIFYHKANQFRWTIDVYESCNDIYPIEVTCFRPKTSTSLAATWRHLSNVSEPKQLLPGPWQLHCTWQRPCVRSYVYVYVCRHIFMIIYVYFKRYCKISVST